MTRVFLVDDHSVFRAGVRAELASASGDVEVVGEAGSVADAVRGIAETGPDVVLLDVHMPDGGGACGAQSCAGSAVPGAFRL